MSVCGLSVLQFMTVKSSLLATLRTITDCCTCSIICLREMHGWIWIKIESIWRPEPRVVLHSWLSWLFCKSHKTFSLIGENIFLKTIKILHKYNYYRQIWCQVLFFFLLFLLLLLLVRTRLLTRSRKHSYLLYCHIILADISIAIRSKYLIFSQ